MALALVQNQLYFSIYIPWPFPPVWGVADTQKKQQKQWGFYSVLLAMMRGLSRVWTALHYGSY